MTSSPIRFLPNLHIYLTRAYLSNISNLILIGHYRAEIFSRKVNRELLRKKRILRHCDLDLRFKIANFNKIRVIAISNNLAKTASKSVNPFGCSLTDTQTDRQTDTQTITHTHTAMKI